MMNSHKYIKVIISIIRYILSISNIIVTMDTRGFEFLV
jgi:hypothetical protein